MGLNETELAAQVKALSAVLVQEVAGSGETYFVIPWPDVALFDHVASRSDGRSYPIALTFSQVAEWIKAEQKERMAYRKRKGWFRECPVCGAEPEMACYVDAASGEWLPDGFHPERAGART